MKKIFLLLTTFTSAGFIIAQSPLTLGPSRDVSVGFHDGYSSADDNFWNATHFSGFSQPSALIPGGENAGWGLIGFDLTSIPDGATVTEATLDLYAFGSGFSVDLPIGHDGDNACWLSRITEDWDQMTVTWNTKPDITDIDQVELPASTDPNEDYIGIDVKTLIQYFVDHPTENFGLALHLQDESPTAGLMFHSSDFADESKWPTLNVTYTEQGQGIIPDNDYYSISISPNPSHDFITLDNLISIKNASVYVKIFNSTGEQVEAFKTLVSNNQINIETLPAGIYNIVVEDPQSGKLFTSSFIKN